MNARQNGFRGGWRRGVVLLVAAGVVLAVGVSGLFADGPDSTKPGLREGVFVPRGTAKWPKSPVAVEGLRRLQERSERPWAVSWDERRGLPRWVQGGRSKSYPGEPEQAAAAFMKEALDLLLGIRDSAELADYTVIPLKATRNAQWTTVPFGEAYKGVRVYHATAAVDVSPTGEIFEMFNAMQPIQLVDVTPTLSKADAEEIIRRAAAPDTVGTDGNDWELCIYPSAYPRLAYHSSRFIRGWWWNLVLDAHDGTEIIATRLGSRDGPGWVTPAEPRDVAPDTAPRQPVPMLPAEPMRPLPEPEKRGLERGTDTVRNTSHS